MKSSYQYPFITELELLCFVQNDTAHQSVIHSFLSDVYIEGINDTIKAYVVQLRQKRRIKLPDAIIAATAMYLQVPLFTADKDFSNIDEVPILLYEPLL